MDDWYKDLTRMREVFTHEKKLDNASFLFCPVFSYDKKAPSGKSKPLHYLK